MPLSLLDLDIKFTPAYIHKIDRPAFWNTGDEIAQRAKNAVSLIFKSEDSIYSFWRVESELDFYCIAASLNANRGSPSEKIPFIWVTDEELESFGLSPAPVEEGKCLYAKKLHYDVLINPDQAYEFCSKLMESHRQVKSCTKGQMNEIIEHLTNEGCRVYNTSIEKCSCEAGSIATLL